jgi:hypothetical protein
MVDITVPLGMLLLASARLIGVSNMTRHHLSKWLLSALDLAAFALCVAFLTGLRLRAPVPGIVPTSMMLIAAGSYCAASYLRLRRAPPDTPSVRA